MSGPNTDYDPVEVTTLKADQVEAEWLNFDALNLGPDHPARRSEEHTSELQSP